MLDEFHSFDQVTRHLAQWQRRRLQADAMLWLPRGLLAGMVAAAAVAALARFRPVLHNRDLAYIALALALLGLIVSFLVLLSRQPTVLEQARYFDRFFDLQERASTAVEIHAGQLASTPELSELQLADTAAIVTGVDVKSRLPLRPQWPDLLMICVAGILLGLAVLLPNDQSTILAEQQAVAEAIVEEVNRLQALEDRIQNDPSLDDASREELLEPVRAVLEELNAGRLSREEAVAALSEAEADLRELVESGIAQSLGQALQEAGQPLAADPLSAALGQGLASGDLAQAAAAASQLAENLAQLSADDRENLAQNLLESAAALAEADPALAASLAESAQALRAGDLGQAQQALQEAVAAMQRRDLEQATAAQAQAAADELQSARGEVASAGADSPNSAATGAGQEGQNGSGQGQGQAVQDSGDGQGANPGPANSADEGRGAGGPGPGGGHADTVFVPEFADLGTEEGAEIQLPVDCAVNPENCGPLISESPTDFRVEQSLVPYEQVFGDYRDAAFEALEGDYVPLGMKGLVREYFSSLEP